MIMKLHTLTHHESRMMPYWFCGQKYVKGQAVMAHWLFENGFRTITDSVINLWSWNFIHLLTMSQGCALLILRSKGQMVKVMAHGYLKMVKPEGTISLHSVWSVLRTITLCNQPMIMKLHTLDHDSRILPLLILGSKGQRFSSPWMSERMSCALLSLTKTLTGQNCHRLLF